MELTLKSQFFQTSSLSCLHLPAAITDKHTHYAQLRSDQQPDAEPLVASCTSISGHMIDGNVCTCGTGTACMRYAIGSKGVPHYVITSLKVNFHVHTPPSSS